MDASGKSIKCVKGEPGLILVKKTKKYAKDLNLPPDSDRSLSLLHVMSTTVPLVGIEFALNLTSALT